MWLSLSIYTFWKMFHFFRNIPWKSTFFFVSRKKPFISNEVIYFAWSMVKAWESWHYIRYSMHLCNSFENERLELGNMNSFTTMQKTMGFLLASSLKSEITVIYCCYTEIRLLNPQSPSKRLDRRSREWFCNNCIGCHFLFYFGRKFIGKHFYFCSKR